MKKGKRVAIVLFWLIFAAVLAGLYFFTYVTPQISGALTRTAVVSYGELKSEDETKALIVRSEKIVYAQDSGAVSYYAPESEKTRKDSKILDIYPVGKRGVGYYCSQTAFISYYVDGYEETYFPDMISTLTPEQLEGVTINPKSVVKDVVSEYEPLYKMLLDDVWYMVFPIPEDRISLYKAGASVTVEFADGEVDATIDKIIGSGGTYLVSVYTKKYYVNFNKIRVADVKVITQDYEGLIVPNSAIAYDENGKPGVYVENINNEFNFRRINIIIEGAEESLVTQSSFTEKDSEGNDVRVQSLELYDEILRNAE
jgi:putative membrane fusion protein